LPCHSPVLVVDVTLPFTPEMQVRYRMTDAVRSIRVEGGEPGEEARSLILGRINAEINPYLVRGAGVFAGRTVCQIPSMYLLLVE
jgi:hypothetical protein